jgi:hypothetical protein
MNWANNRPQGVGIARHFTGLQELTLMQKSDKFIENFCNPKILKYCYEAVEKEFLDDQVVFPACKIPKITIKGFPRE